MPSTLQFGDDARVIVSSTPYGQDGLFASLYQQASSRELRDARAHHASTAEANPTITADVLAAERARDPDTWVAGLDPAFSSDPFGLALVGREKIEARWEGVQTPRLVVGYVRSWKPGKRRPLTFEDRRANEDAVLAEVSDVCLRYGARVVTDQCGGCGRSSGPGRRASLTRAWGLARRPRAGARPRRPRRGEGRRRLHARRQLRRQRPPRRHRALDISGKTDPSLSPGMLL